MSWLKKSILVLGLVGSGSLLSTSCAENESMLFIEGVMALDRSDCVLRPEGNSVLLPSGIMDRALTSRYQAGLLVGSQLIQRGDKARLRTETARMSLLGAEISIESPAGGELIPAYSTIGTGFVNPSSGTEPGFGAIIVEIVPAGATLPEGLVLAKIRAFGETLGGQEVESNEYSFPIQVCTGCLIAYPASAYDDTQPPGSPYLCRIDADTDLGDGSTCLLGQDSAVPCTVCSAYNSTCRDPATNPSAAGP